MTDEIIDQWLDELDSENREFTYRYIYSAYCLAVSRSKAGSYIEVIQVSENVYKFRSSDDAGEITFYSEEDRLFFIEYLKKRFCNDRYRTMEEWVGQQSQYHYEDTHNWTTDPVKPILDRSAMWNAAVTIFFVLFILAVLFVFYAGALSRQ